MLSDHPAADIDRAVKRLQALVEHELDMARVVAFVHPGTPVAWERAGFNHKSRSFFTPSETRKAERDLAWAFKAALGRREKFHDTVAIVSLFYVPTRRAKDVDNCAKMVMDSGTQSNIWKDDRLVIAIESRIDLDVERPRTVIAVCPCLGTLSRAPLLTATGAI